MAVKLRMAKHRRTSMSHKFGCVVLYSPYCRRCSLHFRGVSPQLLGEERGVSPVSPVVNTVVT